MIFKPTFLKCSRIFFIFQSTKTKIASSLTVIGIVLIVVVVIFFLWKNSSSKVAKEEETNERPAETDLNEVLKDKASTIFWNCKSKVLNYKNKYDVNDIEAELSSSGAKKEDCVLKSFNEIQVLDNLDEK